MPGGRTKRLSPEGTALLPKSLSCVKRYSGFTKHRLELHLIRPLLMMLRLMFDVTHHNGLVRTTHAEGSVPFLPYELQSVLMQPPRGVGFQYLNRFGEGDICRKCNQQMRMVGGASGGEDSALVAANAREILAELRNHVVGDEVSSFFGAEDAMDQNVGIFVGHRSNIHSSRANVCAGCHAAVFMITVPKARSAEGTACGSPGTGVPGKQDKTPSPFRDGTSGHQHEPSVYAMKSCVVAGVSARNIRMAFGHACRPFGTQVVDPRPGTSVPGFHIRPSALARICRPLVASQPKDLASSHSLSGKNKN